MYPFNHIRYDSSLYIRELQTYLRALSYLHPSIPRVDIDGVFGRETTDAVKAAQRLFRLPPTGIVDYPTWTAIVAADRSADALRTVQHTDPFVTAFRELEAGDTGDIVSVLQLMLAALARAKGDFAPAAPTGRYDPATEEGMRRLQRASGLPVTGKTDVASWNALAAAYAAMGLW